MRPRFTADVRFVESPDGVFLHSDHGTCTLRGRHAYAWLSRLAPRLDGRHTLAELTAPLAEDNRAIVDHLVRCLVEQRFVVDAQAHDAALPHGLTTIEQRSYADEIAFVGYALGSPERRFERVRQARTVLVGDGPLLTALLEALLGAGWGRIEVVGEAADFAEAIARARRDPVQTVQTVQIGAARDVIVDAEMVLQIGRDLAELVRMSRACHEAGTVLGQALVRATEVWLTPVGRPAVTAAESGWRRLAAHPPAGPRSPGADRLTGPVPHVVASMLALSAFSQLTGAEGEEPECDGTPRALTRVDLRSLDTGPHPFLRHPAAVAAGATAVAVGTEAPAQGPAVVAHVAALAVRSPMAPEVALERAGALVGPRLGVLATLDDAGLTQTPLAVCRATVSDPFGALPGWVPPPRTVGWGEDRPTARLRALLAAVACYGSIAARNGPHPTWGVELPTGQPRTVVLDAPRPVHGRFTAPPGACAGLSWDAAVAAGLRAHCEAVLRTRGTPAGAPVVGLPDGYRSRLLAAVGSPIEVHDISAVLGVPAYSLRHSGLPVIVSAAATAAQALRDGMERLLMTWQCREQASGSGETDPRWHDPDAAGPPEDPHGVLLMAEALWSAGLTPVVVPLGHDPEVAALFPFAVEVVLVDG